MQCQLCQCFQKLVYTSFPFPPAFSSTTIPRCLDSHALPTGALNPRDATCIKGLSLDLASEICWRPRLAGEEGMPCLELLIIIYQENLLPLKPEFVLYTRSKHTKPYFKLFKTIMQLAWLMFV